MAVNYVNEQADTGGHFTEQAYGSSKYYRLREIKARYDPSNLFRLNPNIEPAGGPARVAGRGSRRQGRRGTQSASLLY